MNHRLLFQNIVSKGSYLCVGLDTDIQKIPALFKNSPDPVFEFNKAIIEQTHDLCVAYKPNIAFYESLGSKGWDSLSKTLEIIPNDILVIADAKRGDIGNTAAMYARTFFETFPFDAITLAPYMGFDSIEPFLQYKNKWSVILALTSNKSSNDFQMLMTENDQRLFEKVILQAIQWGTHDQIMFVVGATNVNELEKIRALAPDYFFLIPGIGAQGGNLHQVSQKCMNDHCGILINASRSIIYANSSAAFDKAARKEALQLKDQMKALLEEKGIL